MLRNICEELDRETSNVNENVHMQDQIRHKQYLLMQRVISQYEEVRRFWTKVLQAFMLMFGIVFALDVSTMVGLVMSLVGFIRLTKFKEDHIWMILFVVQTLIEAIRIL